jgi:hypothetical protein
MPTIVANGNNLYYEVHGHGELLVLIPGLGYNGWMWHKMIPGWPRSSRSSASTTAAPVSATSRPAPIRRRCSPQTSSACSMPSACSPGPHRRPLDGRLHRPGHRRRLSGAGGQAGAGGHQLRWAAPHPDHAEAMAVLTDVSGDPIARLRRGIVVSTAPGFAEGNPQLIEDWVNYRVAAPHRPGRLPGATGDWAGAVERGGVVRAPARPRHRPDAHPVRRARRRCAAGQRRAAGRQAAQRAGGNSAQRRALLPVRDARRRQSGYYRFSSGIVLWEITIKLAHRADRPRWISIHR